MVWILIAIGAITIWAASLFKIFISSPCVPSNLSFLSKNGSTNKDGEKRNVLLVIAHPDDESMFFAPTLLFLASQGHSLHVLCLSTGNAEGKGNVRKEELYRACATLKVPQQQVKILDHPNLQDGFHHPWDRQLIATIVEEEIKSCNVDSLLTFDEFGVSGHPNHCDVHHGVCNLLKKSSQTIEAWELVSQIICAVFKLYVHEHSSRDPRLAFHGVL
ncbi:probable N-acetylglucosaminyl-phosphatidylinositol de-N-acetylase isoform X2 [Asparagus officinalis]|uniref:probable N-acetylglucosaminyl-phosphatidylinositol de-N-acetylase isoform X2 n=1 Tax=Asparagus officinalis TaxID=4686 RepID=UPI00098DE8E7|nr:probable N-acetylglucosaminyl-phosphatidylinositol de-N-acetylase isoform X2 [Asparagus officinalis]